MTNIIVKFALNHFQDEMEPIPITRCINKDIIEEPFIFVNPPGICVCSEEDEPDYWVTMDDNGQYGLYVEVEHIAYSGQNDIINFLNDLYASKKLRKMPDVLPHTILSFQLKKLDNLTYEESMKICKYLKAKINNTIDELEKEQAALRKAYAFMNTVQKYIS